MKFHTLRKPSSEQLREIEKFVKEHPDTTYFQSTLFYKACHLSPKMEPFFWVAYTSAGELGGILMAFKQIQYRLFPLSFLSSRMIIWGGPLVLNNVPAIGEGLFTEFEKSKPRTIYTQIRNLTDVAPLLDILAVRGYAYEEHLDIIVDLEKTEEQLWKEVHTKRRNEIRRAESAGVSLSLQQDPETLGSCYEILKEVYLRARLPLPAIGHFTALLSSNDERDGLKIFVAKFEGEIIGCMLCLAYHNTLFDYYAGAYKEHYPKYPNDLIPWEVFKWGKTSGYTRFVFGGAGKPGVPYGVRDYKKKFGGEVVNFGRFEKIHFPGLYKLVLKGFELWKSVKK